MAFILGEQAGGPLTCLLNLFFQPIPFGQAGFGLLQGPLGIGQFLLVPGNSRSLVFQQGTLLLQAGLFLLEAGALRLDLTQQRLAALVMLAEVPGNLLVPGSHHVDPGAEAD